MEPREIRDAMIQRARDWAAWFTGGGLGRPPPLPRAQEFALVIAEISASVEECEALESLRNELLADDYAYWHHDPAITFIDRLIGPDVRYVD